MLVAALLRSSSLSTTLADAAEVEGGPGLARREGSLDVALANNGLVLALRLAGLRRLRSERLGIVGAHA
jgi:hypothetical protein